jgi:hypothetical protein
MALTMATVVVQAKKGRPPISATADGSTVETTLSDSAWIATPPVSMTETAIFPPENSASQLAAALLSGVAAADLDMSLLVPPASTPALP